LSNVGHYIADKVHQQRVIRQLIMIQRFKQFYFDMTEPNESVAAA